MESKFGVPRKMGLKETETEFQRAFNILLRGFEFILRVVKVKGRVESSNLVMVFPVFEL